MSVKKMKYDFETSSSRQDSLAKREEELQREVDESLACLSFSLFSDPLLLGYFNALLSFRLHYRLEVNLPRLLLQTTGHLVSTSSLSLLLHYPWMKVQGWEEEGRKDKIISSSRFCIKYGSFLIFISSLKEGLPGTKIRESTAKHSSRFLLSTFVNT